MPTETRITCKSCGKVSHYNLDDKLNNFDKQLQNVSRRLGALGGNPFLAARKSEATIDFNKCQYCGSRNIIKEKIKF